MQIHFEDEEKRLEYIDAALSHVPLMFYDEITKLAEYSLEDYIRERNEAREALKELIEVYEESDPFPTSDGHPLYRAREVLYGDRAGRFASDE